MVTTIFGQLLLAVVIPFTDAAQPVMGNYEGEWSARSGASGKVTAKFVGEGRDDYKGIFAVERDGETRENTMRLKGKKEGDKVTFSGKLELGEEDGGNYDWTATAQNGEFTMHGEGSDQAFDLKLKRIEKKSPTLGAKPPEGAVVLFDGTNLDQWTTKGGMPAHWKLIDGAMEIGHRPDAKVLRGDIKSKPTFKDAKLHLEFKTPYMPVFRGQLRGNSGVYLQGRYEVQVLDSFGEPPRDNEAGGVYQAAAPKLNASLPPGEWQTYDITFRAPRFDDKGVKVKPAELSVVHNGELIHDKIEIGNITPGGDGSDPKEPGSLLLQDHGNPVQYRNIWFVPLDEKGEG